MMRIRVDKKGSRDFMRPAFGYSQFLEKYSKDGVLDCSYHYQRLRCTICENCGVEIYGVWGYTSFNSFRYDGFGWGQEKYLFQDRPQSVYTRERNISKEFEQLKQKYNEYKDECDAEYNELNNMKACPICGGHITMRDKPLTRSVLGQIELSATVPYWSEEVADKIFQELRNTTTSYDDTKKVNQEIIDFKLKCNDPNYTSTNPTFQETVALLQQHTATNQDIDFMTANKIKADPDLLKQYLLNIIHLSTNYSSAIKRLNKLYHKRLENSRSLKRIEYYPVLQKMEADQMLFDCAEKEYQDALAQLEVCRKDKPKSIIFFKPPKPVAPVYETPGFFNKKKVLARNEELQRKYDSEMAEYNRKCVEETAAIEKETRIAEEQYSARVSNAELVAENARAKMESLRVIPGNYVPEKTVAACPEKAIQRILDEEIDRTENALIELNYTVRKLYSYGVVYEKYRDIVALSTFYEYFMAGRCDSLEGANGAYNLYESEVRANLIITNLQQIERDLQQIAKNQYMICHQLKEMNRSLNDLNMRMGMVCDTLERINDNTTAIRSDVQDMNQYMEQLSKNSSIIAYNTAATAYYSKINAELTNALGFMVALK